MVCLFMCNELSWAVPAGHARAQKTTLAPQLRLSRFSDTNGIDFNTMFRMCCAACELRDIRNTREVRGGDIDKLNNSFPADELEILTDTGFAYDPQKKSHYAVFHLKKQDIRVKAYFPEDVNDETLALIGIRRPEDKEYFRDHEPKGVWFVLHNTDMSVKAATGKEGLATEPETVIDASSYASGLPDSEYQDVAAGFTRELSEILHIENVAFFRHGESEEEEYIEVSGAPMKNWEDTSLHLFINNPNGETFSQDLSSYKQPRITVPRVYLMDARIRKLIVELVREGIVHVDLSEYGTFAPVESILVILDEGLRVVRKAKETAHEIIGEISLTWIEQEKSIITPAVSEMPRMGYVLHPRIMVWPRSGVGFALEVPRDDLKALASAGSEFRDEAVSQGTAVIVPFSLTAEASFGDYLRTMRKIADSRGLHFDDSRRAPFSVNRSLPGIVSAQGDLPDTKEEDIQVLRVVASQDGDPVPKQNDTAQFLENKIKQAVPTFSLALLISATLKGQDEKVLFRKGGKDTTVLCFERGVLVINPVALASLDYNVEEESDNVISDAIRAVLEFELSYDGAHLSDHALAEPENKPGTLPKDETERIHKETRKISRDAAIPAKTVRCHIIPHSLVPAGQGNMLSDLEREMARPRDEYVERVVCLKGDDTMSFTQRVQLTMETYEQAHQDDDKGLVYEFDVACSSTDQVSGIQRDLDIPALAFGWQEELCDIVQVEGIILALRALRANDAGKLREVYKILTGDTADENITDIRALARTLLFKLPVSRVDIDRISEINMLIKKNIENAA